MNTVQVLGELGRVQTDEGDVAGLAFVRREQRALGLPDKTGLSQVEVFAIAQFGLLQQHGNVREYRLPVSFHRNPAVWSFTVLFSSARPQ